MRKSTILLQLLLAGLPSCDKQLAPKPTMVNQFITGEINGVPFTSGITVQMGACVRKDFCDKDAIWINLARKIDDETYQMVFMEYIHGQPGDYWLKDSLTAHYKSGVCTQERVYATSSFQAYPGDDITMDDYRLLEGPWNYLKILKYDFKKGELQGEFGARFVRENKVQHAFDAADTVTYTKTKFYLSNMYIADVITEPR